MKYYIPEFSLLVTMSMIIIDFFNPPIGIISDTTLYHCTLLGTLGLSLGVIMSKYDRRV